MKTVYLAGPITGMSYDDAVDWRENVILRLADNRIAGISPMRAKSYLSTEATISSEYPTQVLSNAKGITTRDRWDCFRCDAVLVNFIGAPKVSIGTVMEIAWADAFRKPVVVAMEAGNPHDHPMIRESVGFVLPTLEDAVQTLLAILLP